MVFLFLLLGFEALWAQRGSAGGELPASWLPLVLSTCGQAFGQLAPEGPGELTNRLIFIKI